MAQRVLRLQIAVEAETRKLLQIAVNEAIAEVMRGNEGGQIVRVDRHAWFTLESASAEPAVVVVPELPTEVGVMPQVVMELEPVDLPGVYETPIPAEDLLEPVVLLPTVAQYEAGEGIDDPDPESDDEPL